MTWTSFFTLLLMNLVGVASPGPDIILVTRYATRSRRHAIAAAAGIQIGVLFWCTATVFGAAALLTAFPEILGAVQAVGGCFLVFMGSRALRSGIAQRANPPVDLEDAAAQLGRLRSAFKVGLATNMSNPKIVLFLAAMIAPLLPASPPIWLAIGLTLSLSLSAFLFFLVVATVISTNAVRRKLIAAGPWLDIGSGLFFIIAGIVLSVSGAPNLLH